MGNFICCKESKDITEFETFEELTQDKCCRRNHHYPMNNHEELSPPARIHIDDVESSHLLN